MSKAITIIGKSGHKKNLLELIRVATGVDSNVLLLGEMGVGKELPARMIHSLSPKRDKPFVKINCTNLSENLLESELFSDKKGACIEAYSRNPDLIGKANGKTFPMTIFVCPKDDAPRQESDRSK